MDDPSPEVAAALTNHSAWKAASAAIRAEAAPFLDDAYQQVASAPSVALRRSMLSRLPDHIRVAVEERLKATWKARITFATDNSPEGIAEAGREAEERGGTLHILQVEGLAVVSEKSPG